MEVTKDGIKKVPKGDWSNPKEYIGISNRFAVLNKLITRDLNNYRNAPTFSLYTKDNITSYLSNPYRYEKQLRRAVIYIYGASPHFRRLIQYFVGLSDLSYIVSPYRIDPRKANAKTINNNYRKVLNNLSSMSIKTQFPKILTVCLREDVFYGTFWVTQDNVTVQQLPSDYCAISSVEGNVPNVTFDFSYFDSRQSMLDYYPPEFKTKYNMYLKNRLVRWIELDSPNSFAVKCNDDILEYAIPPFAGLLREIYDIEDYRQLKLTKTALENYAMIAMTLPMDKSGDWGIDLDKAKEFWRNLDAVLPEEVGSVLTPMPLEKISFASANALLLAIKNDQSITYGIVKSIEDVVNRFIQSSNYGKNFKVTFLDVSPYNRKEAGDAYLKAAQCGLPTISMYAASQGLCQAELDTMSFLEGQVLELHKFFKPIQSSSQMSSKALESKGATDEGGAPQKEPDELTESGEQNREDA